MSKSKRKIDSRQMDIFSFLQRTAGQEGPSEGKCKCIDRLRGAIRWAIKNSPLSRHQIAGEMSHLVGESITKEMIDSWTRESDEANGRQVRHIPAEYLPAFCVAAGSSEPLRLLAETAALFVLPGPEALRAEIQRLDEKERTIKAEKRRRKLFLKEMEGA